MSEHRRAGGRKTAQLRIYASMNRLGGLRLLERWLLLLGEWAPVIRERTPIIREKAPVIRDAKLLGFVAGRACCDMKTNIKHI